MFKDLFDANHICNTAINDIIAIQKPLNKVHGLHLLSYGKAFENGKGYIFFTNRPYWLIRTSINVPFPATYIKEGITPWSELHSEAYIKIAEDFNIYNPIVFFQKIEDGCEAFCFAYGSKDNPGLSFFFSHLQMLTQFMVHFKQEAAEYISQADQTPIDIPDHLKAVKDDPNATYTDLVKKMVSEFQLPQSCSEKKNRLSALSQKEFVCLCYYLTGKTAKEISDILTLSPKTVSAHLYNIRVKLDCKNRSELFKKAWDLGLITSDIIEVK